MGVSFKNQKPNETRVAPEETACSFGSTLLAKVYVSVCRVELV